RLRAERKFTQVCLTPLDFRSGPPTSALDASARNRRSSHIHGLGQRPNPPGNVLQRQHMGGGSPRHYSLARHPPHHAGRLILSYRWRARFLHLHQAHRPVLAHSRQNDIDSVTACLLGDRAKQNIHTWFVSVDGCASLTNTAIYFPSACCFVRNATSAFSFASVRSLGTNGGMDLRPCRTTYSM